MSKTILITEIAGAVVDAYYAEQRRPKFDPKELRLSETGDCPRKRALKALDYPVTHPISGEALRTMEAGNVWEDWVMERLALSGVEYWRQVEVSAPHGAAGHIDAVIRKDGESLIIEVKAVSQWTKQLPDPRHVRQVQAYLHFYGTHAGISRAQIVYIHRENGAGPFTYDVEYDPAEGLLIQEELRALRQDIDYGEVPGIPPEMVSDRFPCSWTSRTGGGYCAYYGHCWGHGQG